MATTKKKIILVALMMLTLFLTGRYVYAQVTQNIAVSATVVPATLELSGYTIPSSLVTISNYGTSMGTTTSASDGTFSKTFSNITPGTYEITIVATDQFSTDTQARTFTFTIQQNQVVTYSNVILPPTIYATTSSFTQVQTGTITVYGRPSATVYLYISGSTPQTLSTTTDSLGKGVFSIDGSGFSLGTYDIYSYFEAAYPSNTLTITINSAPTATPTPLPTATPIPPTGGPGSTATPAPEVTTALTTNPVSTAPIAECPLPFNLLCVNDTNKNGVLDIDTEWDAIIGGLLARTFDVNEDGVVDALDLSIFLNNATIPASRLDRYTAQPVQTDSLCSAVVPPQIDITGIVLAVFFIIIIMLLARVILHSIGAGSGFSIMPIFGIIFFLVASYILYQTQNLTHPTQLLNQFTSKRTTRVDKLNDLVTYDTLISSNGRGLNTIDLYLAFNPRVLKLQQLDLTESLASIITVVEYSNTCGRIHIIGGLPKPAAVLNRELFVRTTFTIRDPAQDLTLVVLPWTRAFEVGNTKESDQFVPAVTNLRVTK